MRYGSARNKFFFRLFVGVAAVAAGLAFHRMVIFVVGLVVLAVAAYGWSGRGGHGGGGGEGGGTPW
jgi:hypothetical protein